MTILREYDANLGAWTGRIEVKGTAAIPCGMWKRVRVRQVHKCALSLRFIQPREYAFAPVKGHHGTRTLRVSEARMIQHADADEALLGRRACPRRKGLL